MHLCDEMLYDQIRPINSELLKHPKNFRYGNNESVRMHDSRLSIQNPSELYRTAKLLIIVKLFASM